MLFSNTETYQHAVYYNTRVVTQATVEPGSLVQVPDPTGARLLPLTTSGQQEALLVNVAL